MKKDYYSSNALLKKRIEQNYEDFIKETLKLEKENIFEYAPTIAAVHEVYFFMTTHDWADEYETEYLLRVENPLMFLAQKWETQSEDRGREFGSMLTELIENDDDDDYMTVSDELRIKYGDDVPLNTAALLELIELGRSLLNPKDLIDYYDYM
jgi:hypothetical protein